MSFLDYNFGTGPRLRDSDEGYEIHQKIHTMLTELYDNLPNELIGGFTALTSMNINNTDIIAWDNISERRLDNGISISTNNETVTVAGTPNRVEFTVNVFGQLLPTTNAQRAAPSIILRRLQDGKIIAKSATGYIRDASGHEESSNNFAATDYAPLPNSSYEIQTRREGLAGNVPLEVDGSQFVVKACFVGNI